MNKVSIAFAIAILCVTCVPVYAQTGVTGTWRVESSPPFEVYLRAEGATLTGVISDCSTTRSVAIYNGTVTGNAFAFKCRSVPDNNRTVTFTGTINNDEIALAWTSQVRDGGKAFVATSPFAPTAPSRFIAKRVPDSELARLADARLGTEFSAALNFREKDIRVEGSLFLPESASRVRAVIVAINWGLGENLYRDSEVRKLAITTESGLLLSTFSNMGPGVETYRNLFNNDGVDGLIALLQRLAQESGRPELADAPLILWGHSFGGVFGSDAFLRRYAQRTIAVVLYHANAADPTKSLSTIPTLIFKGGKDPGGNISQEWKNGRSVGAPWTFALEPNATHSDTQALSKANDLLTPWLTAVLRLRLPSTGTTLRPITGETALLGNVSTGEVTPYGSFAGSKAEANWFPDEASALGWRKVQDDLIPATSPTARIVTDREKYLPGDSISVRFQGAPGNSKDWIALYPAGVQPGTKAASVWFYVNGTRDPTIGYADGTLNFPDGVNVAGDWVAYLLLNDGYRIAASTAFKVEK